MRIGLDCHAVSRDWAGMRSYVLGLVRGLLALPPDHRFALFGFPESESLPRAAETIPPAGRLAYGLLKFGWLSVERFVGDVDVFHSPAFWPLNQRGGRGVVTIADVTPVIRPEWHSRRRAFQFGCLIPRMLRRVERVIAISESTKRDLIRCYALPPDKIDVTPLSASPRFHPFSREEAAGALARHGLDYRGYVLFTGTLEPRKNLIRLLEAHERLAGPPLVVVGKPGWKCEPILRRLEASKAQVRMLGYVGAEDMPALVASAAVFVYPSLYEGFGLPPLEAMQSGVPVVTSNVSSIPEVVGDAAITIDPENVDQLAEEMGRVLGDEALRGRLSEAGLRRAREFSWERTARLTLETYERAVV